MVYLQFTIYKNTVKLNEKLNIYPMNSFNIDIYVQFPNCWGGFDQEGCWHVNLKK